jgi:hypothetical protein
MRCLSSDGEGSGAGVWDIDLMAFGDTDQAGWCSQAVISEGRTQYERLDRGKVL